MSLTNIGLKTNHYYYCIITIKCFCLTFTGYLISIGANINAKDIYGDYVIHFATNGGLISIVQFLIEQQNINKELRGYHNQTPLHYACLNHLPTVKYLIEQKMLM